MASYTDNNGTTFHNQNICRSFKVTLTGLTVLPEMICSEAILINRTGGDVLIYDSGYSAAENALLLGDGESIVLRGVTNSNQISADGTGDFYLRTQYYSNLPQR